MQQGLSRRAMFGSALATLAAVTVARPTSKAPATKHIDLDRLRMELSLEWERERKESRDALQRNHFSLPVIQAKGRLVRKFRNDLAARWGVYPQDVVIHGYLPGELPDAPFTYLLSAVEPMGTLQVMQRGEKKPLAVRTSQTDLQGVRA